MSRRDTLQKDLGSGLALCVKKPGSSLASCTKYYKVGVRPCVMLEILPTPDSRLPDPEFSISFASLVAAWSGWTLIINSAPIAMKTPPQTTPFSGSSLRH
jgi:hypothetical protein